MGGHYGPPLEIDSRNHFWGQIDLWPKKYVKLGLEVMKKFWNVEGVPKKMKKKIFQKKFNFFLPSQFM